MVSRSKPADDSPLGSFVSFYRSRSIPVIVDLGCFGLTRDDPIFNPHLPVEERARHTREWGEFGRTLRCVIQEGVYFPRGTYEALFNASKALKHLADRCVHHPKTTKLPHRHECRSGDDLSDAAFKKLGNDAQISYRAWHDLRVAALNNTIPDVFSNGLGESYARTSEVVGPALQVAFGTIAVSKELVQERLGSLVTGAMTLAAHTLPSRLVGIVSSNTLLPRVFEIVYARTKEVYDPSCTPRVQLHLTGDQPERRIFTYSHNNQQEQGVLQGCSTLD